MSCRIYSEFRPKDGPYFDKDTASNMKTKINQIEAAVSTLDSRFVSVAELVKAQQEYIDTRTPPTSSLESVFKEFYTRINHLESTLNSISSRVTSIEENTQKAIPEENILDMLKDYMKELQNRERRFQLDVTEKLNKIQNCNIRNQPQDTNHRRLQDERTKKVFRKASLSRPKKIRSNRKMSVRRLARKI